MPAVSETLVREFFEQHGFLIRQQRKYIVRSQREDDDVDFFVVNPQPRAGVEPIPFVLTAEQLPGLHRAVVVVKGWHTETFSAGVMTSQPEIFRFVSPAAFRQASRILGGEGPITKVLVLPALPASAEARQQSVEMLRARGVDAVIPFQTILADLIAHVEINRNYQRSDLLQIIRILKNYHFFREPQLELFRSRPRRTRSRGSKGAEPVPDTPPPGG
jgi:hypothetical protein